MKSAEMTDHPEGGRYCRVFHSARTVTTPDGTARAALTHIYYSLKAGEVSRFHRVGSDEVWNLYQGSGLNLYTWDGTETPPMKTTLSPADNCFCQVVPAGIWQAAEPLAEEVLVGCSVAPGFEFADFTLLDPDSPTGRLLLSIAPEMAAFLPTK